MKRIAILAIVLLHIGAGLSLAGQFGPAQPQTDPGQLSLGIGYTRYADKWNFTGFRAPTGEFVPGGLTAKIRQNQLYLQANFGLFRNWEAYLRGGFADMEVDGIMQGGDFRDSLNPYSTAGIKTLFYRGKALDIGGFFEGSYFHEFSDSSPQVRLFIIDEAIVVNAGLTFQKEIEGALLYGGPFYHYREGDYWVVTADRTFRGTLKDDSNIGLFLGIRWKALNKINIIGEVQLRDEFSGGASISYLF